MIQGPDTSTFNGISATRFNGKANHTLKGFAVKARSMILITDGMATFSIDGETVSFHKNCIADVEGNRRSIILESISDNAKGWIFSISEQTLITIMGNRPIFDSRYVHFTEQHICIELTEAFTSELENNLRSIQHTLQDERNIMQWFIVELKVKIFYAEILNYFEKNLLAEDIDSKKSDRASRLFHRLICLLHDFAQTQRNVTFYADRLCVTPQYLGRVVKKTSGLNLSHFIDRFVIIEAKMLLAAEEITMQEVARIMNFSDQSTFAKFFRRMTGIGPLQYRNSLHSTKDNLRN